MLNSLIYFKLIFVTGVRSLILFCVWLSSFPSVIYWRNSFYPIKILLVPFSNISWLILWGFISGLVILFHWSVCLFYTNTTLFDYYSFEIRKSDSPSFVLLSQGCFISFQVFPDLRTFFFPCENCIWNSDRLHFSVYESFISFVVVVVVVQSLSHIWLFLTPWTAACQASMSFTISQSLLKLMSIELVMLSNHLILG